MIRGNLLTVPLAGKLLYVKPLFLQAEESAMPELIRVIAFYDGRAVMEFAGGRRTGSSAGANSLL